MCGRSRVALAPHQVEAAAGTSRWQGRDVYNPSHNVAPGAATPVVRLDSHGHRLIHTMRWGLVPSFTKKGEKPDFYRMFNARSETAAELPSFRRLMPSKRCIVWVNGFYEWLKEGTGKSGGKQPYYIYLAADETEENKGSSEGGSGERPMALAGLWDVWEGAGPDEPPMHTYTILTTDSCKALEWLHDRMPVILPDAAAQAAWVGDGGPGAAKLQSLMGPYVGKDLKWRAVTKAMSNPRYQEADAAEAIHRPAVADFFKPRGKSAAGAGGAAGAFGKVEGGGVGKSGAEAAAVVKKEGAAAEAAAGAPTPNADEPARPPAGSVKIEEGGVDVGVQKATLTPGGTGEKRKKAASSVATPPSAKKKAKERPPGQPDISKFFGK